MKNLFFIFSLAIVLFSCSKDGSNQLEGMPPALKTVVPDVIQILNLLQQPVNGYLHITSNVANFSSQSSRGPEIVVGALISDNDGITKDFGSITCEDLIIASNPNENFRYSDVIGHPNAVNYYGNVISIALEGNGSLPGIVSTAFYVPKMITITNPVYSADMELQKDINLQWIPDENNTFGIGILIEYDPRAVENGGASSIGNSVKTTIHTDDDGSYVITESDLNGIPSGAYVTLSIGRGNYERIPMQTSGYYLGVYSYSTLSQTMTMK